MNPFHALFDLARAIEHAHIRKRARRELMALDDRLLADIGVPRSAIDAVVEGLMRGPVRAAPPAPSPASSPSAANANRPEVAA